MLGVFRQPWAWTPDSGPLSGIKEGRLILQKIPVKQMTGKWFFSDVIYSYWIKKQTWAPATLLSPDLSLNYVVTVVGNFSLMNLISLNSQFNSFDSFIVVCISAMCKILYILQCCFSGHELLCFLLLWNVVIYPHEGFLFGYCNRGWQLFSFRAWNTLFYVLLAFKLLIEKFAIILMDLHL
jgi:hypothetical protein